MSKRFLRQCLPALWLAACGAASSSESWPQFRGPDGNGVATGTDIAWQWSEKENVRWKTAIPGKGFSSPVILSNQIWMTTATQNQNSLRAICVDRDSGRLLQDIEVFFL